MSRPLIACLLLLWMASDATALPVNQTLAANSSLACTTTRADRIIKYLQVDNLNVTVLVATCHSVCSVVLGKGNPDMAGPGVMISYYLQVGLSILFGPLLPLIIRIAKKRSFQPMLRRVALLEKLLLSVVQTSLFYSSSLFIAALVRYSQSPSISESIILGPLLRFQLATMSFLLCGLVLEWRLKDFRIPFDWLLHSVIIIICQGLTCIALEKSFPTMRKESSNQYSKLARACHEIGGDTGPYYDSDSFFYISGDSIGVTGLLIGLPGLWLLMFLIPQNWKRLPEPMMRRLHWKKIKMAISVLVLIFLSYLFAGCIKLLVDVSKAVKENNWGYGQITAVLLWAPFIFEAVIETIKNERSLRAVKQAALPLQGLKSSNSSDQAHGRSVEEVSATEHLTGAQQGESSGSHDSAVLEFPDGENEYSDIVLGVNRRDTEARIEGQGVVSQRNAERAATWQYDRLQDPLEAHRLRRRFT